MESSVTDNQSIAVSVFRNLPQGSLTLAIDPASNGMLYASGDSVIYKWVPGD